MRIKALLVLSALAASATAMALPASAQGAVRSCQQAKQDNQVGGMILGGILGGVLGSNAAASGHKGDGTAVGAVLGGMVGSGIGGGSTRCAPPPSGYGNGYGGSGYPSGYGGYNDNPNYGGPYYDGYGGGGYSPSPYGAAPVDAYPYDPGAPQYRYGQDTYGGSGVRSHDSDRYRLDPDRRGAYSQGDDYAGTDCSEATQVTRLPDGTEVHRPVEVCRDARYGDWRIKN